MVPEHGTKMKGAGFEPDVNQQQDPPRGRMRGAASQGWCELFLKMVKGSSM